MIFSVNGSIGHGKGCVLTLLALRQASKGREVYANYPIHDRRITLIKTWDEVCDLDNADVFLDECHNWFPARTWRTDGKPEDLLRWAQSRHDGINIYWCSQNPSQVDVQVREVFTHFVFKVKRLFGPSDDGELTRVERLLCLLGSLFGLSRWLGATVVVNKFEASEFRLKTKRQSHGRFFLNICKMWDKYDTHYVIGFRDGTGVREGRGRLPGLSGRRPDAPFRDAEDYDRLRYVDPHFPGIVRFVPEIGEAIASRKEKPNGQSVDKDGDLGGGDGHSSDRGLPSRPALQDDDHALGASHRGRFRFSSVKSDPSSAPKQSASS